MKHCRHCNKELPTNRPSFCNEGCSNDFFMAKQKAKQLAEIPRVKAVCRRTGCTNEFMKVGARGKSYCSVPCQVKHNAAMAKVKRDEKLNNRPTIYRTCGKCGIEFEYDRTRPRQGYCTAKCQLANKSNDKKNDKKNAEYARRTAEIKAEGKRKGIDKKWLTRGNVSTGNRDCAISCEA